MIASVASTIEHIRGGRLRAPAVITLTRLEKCPGIPSVNDFVPGYGAMNWCGVGAPKDTSSEDIDKLNKKINVALANTNIKARFADLGGRVFPGSPSDFGKSIADETKKWGK